MDPMGLLRRPVTVRLGFAEGVRAARGTGGGRASAASCWDGFDMTGGKEERESKGGGRGGRGVGGDERRYKAVGCKIGGQDQFKFAVRLGFIIEKESMTSPG